jgi:hypothetical protein
MLRFGILLRVCACLAVSPLEAAALDTLDAAAAYVVSKKHIGEFIKLGPARYEIRGTFNGFETIRSLNIKDAQQCVVEYSESLFRRRTLERKLVRTYYLSHLDGVHKAGKSCTDLGGQAVCMTVLTFFGKDSMCETCEGASCGSSRRGLACSDNITYEEDPTSAAQLISAYDDLTRHLCKPGQSVK